MERTPFCYDRNHPLTKTVPREMFVELQHFDLAGPVIPQIEYLDLIDPILLLWATHDLDCVDTHGLLFETGVGHGRLLVSALRHTGETNAAGRWMLDALVEHLAHGPRARHALEEDTQRRMREKLLEAKIPLVEKPWRFAPDPENDGLKKGWHLPATTDDDWKEIRIGQSWEGQGYPQLDGWAWYRISVDVLQVRTVGPSDLPSSSTAARLPSPTEAKALISSPSVTRLQRRGSHI
jgi:hypothetical protein